MQDKNYRFQINLSGMKIYYHHMQNDLRTVGNVTSKRDCLRSPSIANKKWTQTVIGISEPPPQMVCPQSFSTGLKVIALEAIKCIHFCYLSHLQWKMLISLMLILYSLKLSGSWEDSSSKNSSTGEKKFTFSTIFFSRYRPRRVACWE